jgi:hypothetical protein
MQAEHKRKHFLLSGTSKSLEFTAKSVGGGGDEKPPNLPRQSHGEALSSQLESLKKLAATVTMEQQKLGLEGGLGLQIQFASQPDIELAFQSLANETKGIELLSVRTEGTSTFANVFVPEGRLAHFENYITEYLSEKKDKNGNARDHSALFNTIAEIRSSAVRSLWTDDISLLPTDATAEFWWEVWLRVGENRNLLVADFRKLATLSGCLVREQQANFPERTVLLMRASEHQFAQSVHTLNCVAELRRAKETAEFFDGMAVSEQRQWSADLLRRLEVAPEENVPFVCVLDSGVNRGHPLLAPLLDSADLHSVEPAWGIDDSSNHGTGLAGLIAFGDLTEVLSSPMPWQVGHRMESVKLIPNEGGNQGSVELHAALFAEGVARPEIQAPLRQRVFTSAVTASDYRDRGQPSSWSSMVDRLSADSDNQGANPRLFILSAGNIREPAAWATYPDCLATNLIHDPGQAWNALTIGAYTEKWDTENHPSLLAVAPIGGLSPFSTTSKTWESAWPLKPDLVMEGGNVAKDNFGAVGMSSLNLLTLNNRPDERLFTTSNATSAASALCARMAAQIMATYPSLRPETVRALLVHSARWTDQMRKTYLASDKKLEYVNLIRHCGWGVPNLEQALWSASNSLTLIVEDAVHPYGKPPGKDVKTKDMHLHSLPWPRDELEALLHAEVELRITLSYFVEPNPSARGTTSKFHYPSHRLRFDVQRPLESVEDFVARINAKADQDEDQAIESPKDANWYLGGKHRFRGSLHQDVWRGTAADLASRGAIAVYPGSGWWRSRPKLQKFDMPARYSMIVSIRTAQTEVDLYSAIQQQIVTANRTQVSLER